MQEHTHAAEIENDLAEITIAFLSLLVINAAKN